MGVITTIVYGLKPSYRRGIAAQKKRRAEADISVKKYRDSLNGVVKMVEPYRRSVTFKIAAKKSEIPAYVEQIDSLARELEAKSGSYGKKVVIHCPDSDIVLAVVEGWK